MKKSLLFACLIIFSLSASTASPAKAGSKPDKGVVPDKTENRMTEEEFNRLTRRVEEIRDMDKTTLTTSEKKELRKELRGIKENMRRDGGYLYIGGGTLLLILILIILLV
jgi:hypothetical protein